MGRKRAVVVPHRRHDTFMVTIYYGTTRFRGAGPRLLASGVRKHALAEQASRAGRAGSRAHVIAPTPKYPSVSFAARASAVSARQVVVGYRQPGEVQHAEGAVGPEEAREVRLGVRWWVALLWGLRRGANKYGGEGEVSPLARRDRGVACSFRCSRVCGFPRRRVSIFFECTSGSTGGTRGCSNAAPRTTPTAQGRAVGMSSRIELSPTHARSEGAQRRGGGERLGRHVALVGGEVLQARTGR